MKGPKMNFSDSIEPRKKFPCPICSKLFKTKLYIPTHILNAHKGVNPNTNIHENTEYLKSSLDPGYSEADNYVEEESVHSDKGFTCSVCSSHFLKESRLKSHICNRFQCIFCPLTFSQNDSLQEHFSKFHEGRDDL